MTKDVENAPWYSALRAEIEAELTRLRNPSDDGHAALTAERVRLDSQIRGWRQTLANPELSAALRADIEADYTSAADRIREIEAFLLRTAADEQFAERLVTASEITERLDRLAAILASENATLGNLELSQHIDRIDCHPSGKAVMRICRLGPLGMEAITTIGFSGQEVADVGVPGLPSTQSDGPASQVVPRRRAKLRVDDAENPSERLRALAEWAADPHRFAGLDEQWFDTVTFTMPEPLPWYQEYAEAVLARVEQLEAQGLKVSLNKLAKEFGVSRPTLSRALKTARARRQACDGNSETNAA